MVQNKAFEIEVWPFWVNILNKNKIRKMLDIKKITGEQEDNIFEEAEIKNLSLRYVIQGKMVWSDLNKTFFDAFF